MKHRSCSFGLLGSVLGGIALITLCGCQQVPVRCAFGRGWNLDTGLGRLFDWIPPDQTRARETWARNASADDLIRATVERGFTAKGYHRACDNPPNFWINYHVIAERKEEWLDFGPVVEYHRGALYLDVIDPASKEVLWRGMAEGKLEAGLSPDEVKRRIEVAVPLILKRLPDYKPQPE